MPALVIFLVIMLSAAALAVGLTVPAEALLAIINRSFLAGLFLLVLGVFALVVRSGVFAVFGAGFKRLQALFFRRPRVMESDWYSPDDPVFARKKETFVRIGTSLLLWGGAALVFFSVALTVWYYR